MSRALTVFSRREHQNQYKDGEVERIMAEQGCSEPVAKNLIKYAKLGVGPLAAQGSRDREEDRYSERDRAPPGSSRDQFPPRLDRKAAAALAEQKLRERQEEEEALEAKRHIQPRKNIGLSRLGPVMAREDEVDPFRQLAAAQAGKKDGGNDKEHEEQGLAIFEARPPSGRPMAKKPMQIAGISSLGPVMAKLQEADAMGREMSSKAEEDDDEDDDDDKDDSAARHFMDKKRPQQDDDKWRAGKKKKRRKGKEDDRSSEEDLYDEVSKDAKRAFGHEREGKAREQSPPSGSLMSEKQVMAMMGKQRKVEGTKRGSVRAQSRIQKEREEWERAKANNPEFWKAPQFALCYSAETGKKARGAG